MAIKLSIPRITDEEAVDKFLAGLRDSHARIHIKDNIDTAEPMSSEAIRAAHTYEGNRLDAVSGGTRGVSVHMNDLQVDDPMDLSVVERRELYNMMKSWNNSGGRGSAHGGTRGGDRSSVQCHNCKGYGHFMRECPSPTRDQLNYAETGAYEDCYYDASTENKDIDPAA
ncbi:hypothetical protein [Parasitella parasitica]|uniref:CCHC-type domain-containing protein n=1 Tax=Parasitella parasitica TaxID=35722 RepID=A0A0B7N0P9_9FUNG|nr:hypothetical protein [Parasitella parasitica]